MQAIFLSLSLSSAMALETPRIVSSGGRSPNRVVTVLVSCATNSTSAWIPPAAEDAHHLPKVWHWSDPAHRDSQTRTNILSLCYLQKDTITGPTAIFRPIAERTSRKLLPVTEMFCRFGRSVGGIPAIRPHQIPGSERQAFPFILSSMRGPN